MEIDLGQAIQDEAALSELYGPALERSVRKQPGIRRTLSATRHLLERYRRQLQGQTESRPMPCLLDDLTSPAVTMRPEWTLRARSPFRIIDSLRMWAADDLIRHYDRLGAAALDEFTNFERHRGICAHVSVFGKPPLQIFRLGI